MFPLLRHLKTIFDQYNDKVINLNEYSAIIFLCEISKEKVQS